jgi:hypothetical protein
MLPQWIEYHRLQGIESFWIYLNDSWESIQNATPAVYDYLQRPDVQSYASILSYQWTENLPPFYTQHAALHDCHVNAINNGITWLLLNDVDEMATVLQVDDPPHSTVSEFLETHEQDESVAVVSIQNFFFGVGNNTGANYTHRDTKAMLFPRDLVYRSEVPSVPHKRSKMFIKPTRISVLDVHKAGLRSERALSYIPNPYTEM